MLLSRSSIEPAPDLGALSFHILTGNEPGRTSLAETAYTDGGWLDATDQSPPFAIVRSSMLLDHDSSRPIVWYNQHNEAAPIIPVFRYFSL